MCSTCCALGVDGEYLEHKLLVAKDVVIRLCVELSVKEKIIEK